MQRREKKKNVQPNTMLNTLTAIFKGQSCTYLLEILPLAPAAESCASPTEHTAAFGMGFYPCEVEMSCLYLKSVSGGDFLLFGGMVGWGMYLTFKIP